MAGWSGAGIFTKTHSWVADAANGIKVRADRHDANDTDFTNGINNCLTKDGQNAPSGNLPMGGNKHTAVGNATASNDYLAMGQFQGGSGIYVVTSGSANTYVASTTPAITAYAAGQRFLVKINANNTGASTVNFNAVGAKALVKSGAVPLAANELMNGRLYTIIYDGTNFQVDNPTAKPQIITGAHATAFTNEVPLNGDTVAKATNGDLNGVQFELQYKYLWDNFANAQAAVAGGRGASAQADWDAEKNIAAPNFEDRTLVGVDSGGSITAVGAVAGATTVASSGTNGVTGGHSLTTAQMPAHTHNINYKADASGGGSGGFVALNPNATVATTSTGSGNAHTHTGSVFSGTASSVLQKSIGVYWYVRA